MIDFCNHIRIGEVTAEELKLLNRRHVDTLHSMQLNDARRRVPTNARADHHNAERLETFRERSRSMIRDFGQPELPLYNVTAVDTHFDTRRMEEIVVASLIPLDSNKCGRLSTQLGIAPGVRVMLRRNIHISSGLVNGAMFIIKDITGPIFGRD